MIKRLYRRIFRRKGDGVLLVDGAIGASKITLDPNSPLLAQVRRIQEVR